MRPSEQHHVGLDFGLTGELGLDPRGAAIEEVERGDVGGVGAGRIGDLEEAREKAADLARLGRLAGRDPRLPRHPDEPADERQQHERRRRHADGVAAHELARAIPDRVPPRGDGQAALIPADILDQRARRRIPARGFLLQRLS